MDPIITCINFIGSENFPTYRPMMHWMLFAPLAHENNHLKYSFKKKKTLKRKEDIFNSLPRLSESESLR